MSENRTRVLVMFGGRSPEHDVSVITGLQAAQALDPLEYETIPLYISPTGEWFIGDALWRLENYIPSPQVLKNLTPVSLPPTPRDTPALTAHPHGWWQRSYQIEFDVALLAFHGLIGEDGRIQGLLETAEVPYTGMRPMASTVLMDKIATKRILAGTGVPMVPFVEIKRPTQGMLITVAELEALVGNFAFPCCIKPAHLGSSIGVARVENLQEVSDVLASSIFRYDDTALLEPFVENLVEYNVAVRRGAGGHIITSAIECPKRTSELLDFKTKYMSGGDGKIGGGKTGGSKSGAVSEGMLSLTRDINPTLSPEMEAKIRRWAIKVFACVDGNGCPRLDFLCNGKTEEIWFNEANPIPGSFGYFLWEASKQQPTLFAELLDGLISEALSLHKRTRIPTDPTPLAARLFPRK